MTCPYCVNGRISVDGGSLGYRCTDCDGTGERSQCDNCGQILPPSGVESHDGQTLCHECREQIPEDLWQHRHRVGEQIWNLMTS